MRWLAFLFCLLLPAVEVRSEVLCPRVLSEHNADVTDLRRFREYHQWKDKRGQELAVAVWQYLCDTETGLFHMDAITDGPDPWSEYSLVRDPIKLMNVYNVGFCGIFGPVMDGVFQGVGFERGRRLASPSGRIRRPRSGTTVDGTTLTSMSAAPCKNRMERLPAWPRHKPIVNCG